MLAIHERGEALLQIGVPVQQLLAMPALTTARRCKSNYTNEQIDELRACGLDIQREFDRLRAKYVDKTEATT